MIFRIGLIVDLKYHYLSSYQIDKILSEFGYFLKQQRGNIQVFLQYDLTILI